MKQPNTRIARLQEMIALEEKRATLQGQISTVNERLAAIQNELYGARAVRAERAQRAAMQKALFKMQPKRRKGRGELKRHILELLQASGKTGASVQELAGRIGIKPVNVYAWFGINLKKIAGLKKIGKARYALNGTAALVEKAAPKAKAVKAGKTKAVKSSKALKASKPAKVVKKSKANKKSGRGELKKQIINALKSAGDGGITIKALAAKLNANYKNLYIWFVTTGKRIAEVKKVGPAQYKWQAAA